jgi:tRNA 2-thiocytidine biosynthesis protein TtcA
VQFVHAYAVVHFMALQEIGATKVALGHHRDDIIATFFLNLFHGGSLKAMPPKLLSSDKKNILIRPLAYVEEKDIIKYAEMRQVPNYSM